MTFIMAGRACEGVQRRAGCVYVARRWSGGGRFVQIWRQRCISEARDLRQCGGRREGCNRICTKSGGEGGGDCTRVGGGGGGARKGGVSEGATEVGEAPDMHAIRVTSDTVGPS